MTRPGVDTAVPHDHLVTFYESDGYLVDAVVGFLGDTLERAGSSVVIATPDHASAIRASIAARGIDPSVLAADGRLVMVDAAETLDAFTVAGRLDPRAFEAEIGRLVDEAGAGGREIRAFGEMVALLWDRGDVAGAIRLEEMWNELAATRTFTLLCAYRIGSFDGDDGAEGFQAVCARHSSVIPTEGYSRIDDPDQRLRHVAALERSVVAGGTEMAALRAKQAELEEALARLQELDRLRREFTAMVVHDIRVPVAVVSGFLDLLSRHWEELSGEEVRDFLARSTQSTARIERLIEDILTMSRLESGEFSFDLRPLDLGEVVERAAGHVSDATGRDIAVSRPDSLQAALVDEDRQMQILTNLLSNAVKFSPDGAPVSVTVEERPEAIVVSVVDDGPGIAPEQQERLFRPFARLDTGRSGGADGSGLGLYIAKALVEGQGGSIWVESEPGRGASFSYTALPVGPGH